MNEQEEEINKLLKYYDDNILPEVEECKVLNRLEKLGVDLTTI